MVIAPITSILMAFTKSRIRETDVTVFIFLSSFPMAVFVLNIIAVLHGWIPEEYGDQAKLVYLLTYTIMDFRFPILCVLSLIIVADIRRAVMVASFEAILYCFRKDKSIKTSNDYVNAAFVE
ncbi:hypothetical protein PMAYCL1PPCAC_21988 [Pristionchus mayeri]|uniref:Uncharacterized protein n=1 Tax=Pristionchus mayeri TaxID=1317129 RepID=A0AAN5I4E0_9BILA|nr:hypothetical protein PMAYCL1PPCAC_21988 [Pristionchus mayeri]